MERSEPHESYEEVERRGSCEKDCKGASLGGAVGLAGGPAVGITSRIRGGRDLSVSTSRRSFRLNHRSDGEGGLRGKKGKMENWSLGRTN